MIVMYLGKADVNSYEKGAGREFLVTNGLGDYGFSTVIGANTRREHGLLVVRKSEKAAQPFVLISKVEETVSTRGKKYQLSTNRYKDVTYPDGYRYVQEYEADPLPATLFVIHSTLLRKTVFMPRNSRKTILKYELLASPESIHMDIRPLAAHRPANEIRTRREEAFFQSEISASSLSINGGGRQSYIYSTKGEWRSKPLWFENMQYDLDECDPGGLDHLWSPGTLSFTMEEGDVVYVVLSSETAVLDDHKLKHTENETIQWIRKATDESDVARKTPFVRDLILSAIHCLCEPEEGSPVVFSGYPSVRQTARETFLSLPGLALSTGRETMAEAVLYDWLSIASANDFVMPGEKEHDTGKPVFNAADAGLWFFYALEHFCRHVGSTAFVSDNWNELKQLLERLHKGIPGLGLSLEQDGLLSLDEQTPPLHWMDGVVDSRPVVLRKGKLVEINALWYFSLRTMEQYAELLSDDKAAATFGEWASLAGKSFPECFWSGRGFLYDWVDGSEKDESVRCNQLLAVSLSVSPLDPERGRAIVETCWNELYTTYGIRSLDPRDDKYKGRCEGRKDQKEKARFRGMAWPWMLGQFVTAFLKYNPERSDIALCFLRPFRAHIRKGCLGVAQTFDGSMPYLPHGDALFAPSVGELLRVFLQDL